MNKMCAYMPPPPRTSLSRKRMSEGLIGHERGGEYDCYEYTYYYTYTNPEIPSQSRYFEMRVRVGLRWWMDPKVIERTLAPLVDDRMTELTNIDLYQFEKQSKGIRAEGKTSSRKAKYKLLNKQTKRAWPHKGWGSLLSLKQLRKEVRMSDINATRKKLGLKSLKRKTWLKW